MSADPESDNCQISTDFGIIRTWCASSSGNYQVIAQLTTASDLQKLYTNESMSPETPVTIPVERDGEYLVSLIAIREGMGILDSMPFRKVVLQVLSATTMQVLIARTTAAPTTTPTTTTTAYIIGKYKFYIRHETYFA